MPRDVFARWRSIVVLLLMWSMQLGTHGLDHQSSSFWVNRHNFSDKAALLRINVTISATIQAVQLSDVCRHRNVVKEIELIKRWIIIVEGDVRPLEPSPKFVKPMRFTWRPVLRGELLYQGIEMINILVPLQYESTFLKSGTFVIALWEVEKGRSARLLTQRYSTLFRTHVLSSSGDFHSFSDQQAFDKPVSSVVLEGHTTFVPINSAWYGVSSFAYNSTWSLFLGALAIVHWLRLTQQHVSSVLSKWKATREETVADDTARDLASSNNVSPSNSYVPNVIPCDLTHVTEQLCSILAGDHDKSPTSTHVITDNQSLDDIPCLENPPKLVRKIFYPLFLEGSDETREMNDLTFRICETQRQLFAQPHHSPRLLVDLADDLGSMPTSTNMESALASINNAKIRPKGEIRAPTCLPEITPSLSLTSTVEKFNMPTWEIDADCDVINLCEISKSKKRKRGWTSTIPSASSRKRSKPGIF